MRKTFEDRVGEFFKDLGYTIRRASAFIIGKGGIGLVIAMANFHEGALEIIGSGLAVVGAMGISAGLVQMDHTHRKAKILDRYRTEIGKFTGRDPARVQEVDLMAAANGDSIRNIPGNPTLKEAIADSSLQRNLNVVLSAVTVAATYFVVHAVFPEPLSISGGVGNLALDIVQRGVVGLVSYNAIKTPLHYISSKILGLQEDTIDDRITHMRLTRSLGKMVSQEQVLDVFIEAHPQINTAIEAQFGRPFEELKTGEKIRVMQSIPPEQFNLRKITEEINLGHVRPEELAFMAFGQNSGVARKERDKLPTRPALLDNLWDFLHDLTAGWTAPARKVSSAEVSQALPELKGKTDYTIYSPDENNAAFAVKNTHEHEGEKKSFTAMVGRKKTPENITHVERYEQSKQTPNNHLAIS